MLPAYRVGVHPQNRCPGKQLLQLLLHLLGAGANGLKGYAALRAFLGKRLRIAAIMAHHPPVGGVIGQIDAAPGALRHITAARADHLSAVASAVEKQNRLLSQLQIFLYLPIQGLADGRAVSLPQLLAHVCQSDRRQRILVVSFAQQRQVIVSLLSQVRRFNRRSRGPEDQPRAFSGTAEFGNIPGMVARRILRFVGTLLLLVYHDHTQMGQRCKHGGSCSQHDLCHPFSDAFILVIPLCDAQSAV